VYALLGGKTKDRLPVYCTTAKADVAKRHGFAGAKVPCPHGPAAGDEGFRANVAYFKAQREKVGPDFPLMLDCYMALTLPYTVRLAKALEPHGLKWIEECLPPDDYDGYKELRQAPVDDERTQGLNGREKPHQRAQTAKRCQSGLSTPRSFQGTLFKLVTLFTLHRQVFSGAAE